VSRRAKWITVTALLACAAACASWAWFLARQGLDRADKWSSVMAGFAAVILGVLGLVGGWVAGRQPTTPAPTDAQARHGTGSRSVDVGGDNSGVIVTGDDNTVEQRWTP
jgi:uncharacterized membrane protein